MNERTYSTPLGKIHYWVHLISPDGVTLVQRLRHVPVKPYNETPSFAISLLKEYRKYGIGTELMKQMLMKLKLEGYKQASLAVQKMNYAVRMYRKVGFEIVDENDEEYIMICNL